MKKIILTIGLLFLIGNVFGGESYYSHEYYKPDYQPKLEYTKTNEGIKFSWDKANEYDFKYYKLVRSETKSNPVYPDDGYIFASGNLNENYVIKNYNDGYFNICHIYKGFYDKGNNTDYRTCSESVHITKSESEKTSEKTSTNSYNYSQKEKIKIKAKLIIKNFNSKLENIDISNQDKINKINKIIEGLYQIKTRKPSLAWLLEYMISEMNKLEKYYEQEDLTEIENLFDI